MRTALGRRHSVAIASRHAISITNASPCPANGPFDAAMPGFFGHLASERHGCNRRTSTNMFFQIIF